MRFCGEHDAGIARMHIREFSENSVDFQHFDHVHGGLTIPWTTRTIPGFRLQHRPRWWVDEDRPHARGTRTLVKIDSTNHSAVPWTEDFRARVAPYCRENSAT